VSERLEALSMRARVMTYSSLDIVIAGCEPQLMPLLLAHLLFCKGR